MSRHTLTPTEIIRLGREYENLRRWEAVRDFISTLYGTRAQQVTLSILSEYNDFRYDDEVSITVLDKASNQLGYDFTLPWWSQFVLTPADKEQLAEPGSQALRIPSDIASAGEIVAALLTLFTKGERESPLIYHWG